MPSENLRARAARYKGGLEYFVLTTVGLIPSHVARKALYRLFGMKIDRSAWIYARCEVRSPHGITIGANSVIGIDGMSEDEARPLLTEWYQWQTREEFWYRHEWEPQMLVMWDNRSVLHRATGGYEGHDRLLHRTTIAAA